MSCETKREKRIQKEERMVSDAQKKKKKKKKNFLSLVFSLDGINCRATIETYRLLRFLLHNHFKNSGRWMNGDSMPKKTMQKREKVLCKKKKAAR
jgi:hypothetical protein